MAPAPISSDGDSAVEIDLRGCVEVVVGQESSQDQPYLQAVKQGAEVEMEHQDPGAIAGNRDTRRGIQLSNEEDREGGCKRDLPSAARRPVLAWFKKQQVLPRGRPLGDAVLELNRKLKEKVVPKQADAAKWKLVSRKSQGSPLSKPPSCQIGPPRDFLLSGGPTCWDALSEIDPMIDYLMIDQLGPSASSSYDPRDLECQGPQ
ncbi:hypothetical protein Dimus_022714 [Dionaea muscipula]